MARNIFKNITVSLLVLSFVLLPFLNFPAKAYAQSIGSGAVLGNGTSQGLGGYMQAVGPMIPKLQGCRSMVSSGIKSGLNSIKSLFSGSGSGSSSGSSSTNPFGAGQDFGITGSNKSASFVDDAKDAFNQAQDIGVIDQTLIDLQKTGNATAADTKKATQDISANQTCLNSVGKMIAKLMIQKLTLSTVAWINTGNFGDSFAPRNQSSFFQDIGKNEILKFGQEIANSALYPFGQNFMQNTAMAVKNHFAQNAQYSLNKMIQDTTPQFTTVDFKASFAAGGWSAWDAMTQVPANNPLGFQLMAQTELSKRLDGTSQSVAKDARDYLAQNSGFLGQQQCADPVGMTAQQDHANLVAGVPGCKRWEYVTPGGMIAHAATQAIDFQNNQYLNINDLNDAMAAILDAGLNKWGSDLMDPKGNGLAGLADVQNNQINLATGNGQNVGQAQNNIPAGYNYDGSWFNDHPNFDITVDLNQALIDEQRTYTTKLADYDTSLLELITWIRQLDYCIPGPNPDWQQISSDALNNIGNVQTNDGKNGWQIASEVSQFGTLASVIPGAGPWIGIGSAATSMITGAIGQSTSKKAAEDAAADAAERILGVHMDSQDQINSTEGVKNLLSNVFNNYADKINKIYFSGRPVNYSGSQFYMPEVTNEGRALYEQIPGYQQTIENNQKEIIFYQDLIKRLEGLKYQVDNQVDASGNSVSASVFHDPNSDIVKEFARLSSSLKNGDDVANAVSLVSGTNDKTKHVRDDLVQGPYGCEKDLEKLLHDDPRAYQAYARREPYPLPIPYFYSWPINDGGSNILIDQHGNPTVTFDANGNVVSGGPYRMPYGSGSWSGYKTFADMFNAFTADFNEHNFLFGSYYYSPQTTAPVVGHVCLSIVSRIDNDGNSTSQAGGGATAATLLDLPTNSGHLPLSNGSTPNGGYYSYTSDSNHDGANCGQLKDLERSFNVY